MPSISFRRIFRRIKYVFLFRGMSWKYESCQDCGHCFRLVWSVKDYIWRAVTGDKDGGLENILCLDCFVDRATKKGVAIKEEDFDIEIFLPE